MVTEVGWAKWTEHLPFWHSFYSSCFCLVTSPVVPGPCFWLCKAHAGHDFFMGRAALGSLLQLALSSRCVLKLVYIC